MFVKEVELLQNFYERRLHLFVCLFENLSLTSYRTYDTRKFEVIYMFSRIEYTVMEYLECIEVKRFKKARIILYHRERYQASFPLPLDLCTRHACCTPNGNTGLS